MPQINVKQINYNHSSRVGAIKYLVIHDTDNPGATAANHRTFFNKANQNSSADFFVDDTGVIEQLTQDLRKTKTWHVGDGNGAYGITNNNSIGIEMCMPKSGIITKKVFEDTVWLAKKIMKDYNISKDCLVMHWHASRKNCPAALRALRGGYSWDDFKNAVLNGGSITPPVTTPDSGVDANAFWRKCDANANKNITAYANIGGGSGWPVYKNEKVKIQHVVSDNNINVPIELYSSSSKKVVKAWAKSFDINLVENAVVINVSSKLLARYTASSTGATMGQCYNNEKLLWLKDVGNYSLCAYNTTGGHIKVAYFTKKYIRRL